MSTVVRDLTGLQKAGVLMMSLGAETSAKVFDHLTSSERDLLGSEIVKLQHVDDMVRRRVLDEVNAIVRQQTLQAQLGMPPVGATALTDNPRAVKEEIAAPVVSDEPLKWLDALDPKEVASLIAGERAQNVALVLAHISPHSAAAVLSYLKENVRNQVAHRLATMKPVAKEAVEAVDDAMRRRAGASVIVRETKPGILNGAAERVRESVKGALGMADTASLPKIGRSFATPEDMVQLSDLEMKAALAEIDFDDLCKVIRIAGDDMRAAVLRNVSEEAGLILHRELASNAQIRVREIEQAQSRTVTVLNRLFSGQSLEAGVG